MRNSRMGWHGHGWAPGRRRAGVAAAAGGLVCGLAVWFASAAPFASPARAASGFVTLAPGDIVDIRGTKLSCLSETRNHHPQDVVGVECGLGEHGALIRRSYWISLRIHDQVIAAKSAHGQPLAHIVYARPKHQTLVTAIGEPRFKHVNVSLGQVMHIGDTHMWCAGTKVTSGDEKGFISVSCWQGDAHAKAVVGSTGLLVSARFAAVIGYRSHTVKTYWVHQEPR